MIRYTVHFQGRVQGVGFRYTAVNIAHGYDVVGYVQNLPDRRVVLVAEGQEAELKAFVNALLTAMKRYVQSHTMVQGPATGEFGKPGEDEFSVRY